ncbi:MAG TPA: sodium:proton antiporter [Thioalkalivibrio sp.]|nr:sodium:proton antiporter [Thioalkalivibrio sp.]
MNRWASVAVALLCAVLALALAWAMWDLPPAPVALPAQVAGSLAISGVEHPVTAVLLNFRGYDTLLEVGVLLIALLGMLAAGATPERMTALPPDPVLEGLARLLAPLMVLVAGYLLWAGAFRPGGAFQAAAVLAAAGVLLRLAGPVTAWTRPGRVLRLALAAGFVVFLAVAVLGLAQGAMLEYPRAWAGSLILAVEAGLTVSLGLTLAGLFLAGPEIPRGGPRT